MEIVFFDGFCGLCNGFVNFLLKNDSENRLRFSPLQGKTIQTTKAAPYSNEGSLIFLRGDKVFLRSDAVIHSIMALGGIGKWARVFLIVPRFFRDGVYKIVAGNRYRFFGKRAECRIPSEAEKSRFME